MFLSFPSVELRTGRILQMIVTNLRNRPVSSTDMRSMCRTVLSLYHSLTTGSKDFPLVPIDGRFTYRQVTSPFGHTKPTENTTPPPFMDAPAGLMVPAVGSSSSPDMLTAVFPEKTELAALRADRRNCVRSVELDGRTVTRVVSTVYHSNGTELTNRWRVSDYSTDGHLLMSILCQFTKKSARYAGIPTRRKRKATEEESDSSSSSQPPPKKCLRL